MTSALNRATFPALFTGFLLVFPVVSVAQAPVPQTAFEFVSAPGDYIGAGQTVILTPTDVTFTTAYSSGHVGFSMTNFSNTNNIIFWYLDMAARNGHKLTVGSYPNATRYPFEAPGVPGLALEGDGRGCNQDFGSFQVLEIAVDPTGQKLLKFAANFVQFCESPNAPGLSGAIRYNSTIPLPELIQPTITFNQQVNARGCYEATSPAGTEVTAIASARDSDNNASLTFAWSTSTGLTGSGTQFSVPIALNQNFTLLLTATDPATGATTTASAQICSSDTTPPTVAILSPVANASYNELPIFDVAVFDAVDRDIQSVQVRLGEDSSYKLGRNQQLRTRLTPKRAIGGMIETQITVLATDASGNTGQATVTFLIDKKLL